MLNNKVIELLDLEHGQKVKAYFQSKGVDFGLRERNFNSTRDKDNEYRYYGIIDGSFGNYDIQQVQAVGAEIIPLPTTEYPKVMWVSDQEDFSFANKRVVFVHKNGYYLAWESAETIEAAEKIVSMREWKYAKDIEPEPEPQIVELTIEDISAGKGVGIAPHLIRIKK